MKKKINYLFKLLTFLIIISCNSSGNQEEGAREERPNIVIIFSDELQFEDISYFGGNIQTPNIDELIRSGMLFENAYTPEPMCTPSRYSLLTGKYAGKCKAPEFLNGNPETQPYTISLNTYLDSTVLTLPRLLSENGYVTGMAGKWHLGGEQLGEVELDPDGDLDDPKVNKKLAEHQALVIEKVKRDGGFDFAKSVVYGNYDMFPIPALHQHNFPWVTKGAVEFIEQQSKTEQPFFLYMTPTALHGPHHATGLERDYSYTLEGKVSGIEPYVPDINYIKNLIDTLSASKKHRHGGMAFLDHQVGLMLKKLEELEIQDNTVVLFLPDHNTEPAKATTYEKGLKIPLALRWPGKVAEGTKTEASIQTVDLFPTLLRIAGVQDLLPIDVDGLNLSEVIADPRKDLRKEIFSEAGFTRAIRKGKFKYIALRYTPSLVDSMKRGLLDHAPNYLNKENQGQSIIAATFYPHYFDADQLYDLEKDPYEQTNLAYDRTYQSKLVELQADLQMYLNRFEHPFDLADTTFLRTERFAQLASKTKEQKPEDIWWYKRDWEQIIWPPVQDAL